MSNPITPLCFPKADLKLKKQDGKINIWDDFRKKWLVLTPEEWVRQHILHFFVNDKSVPQSLISVEHSLEINQLKRRCDAVIFNNEGSPVAILECKAPQIRLSEEVLFQMAQYNFKLRVKWLIMSNGIQTITAKINQENDTITYLEQIPNYEEMK